MKKVILTAAMLIATFMSCKKSSSPAPAIPTPLPAVKTYAVLYKFTTTSTATNFEISYVDASGVKTIYNQSSGWTYSISMNAGSYTSLSVTSHTVNASADAQIFYNNSLLDEKYASGSGTYAFVLADGTLPN